MAVDKLTLTNAIKAKAHELGFDKVGVAPVDDVEHAPFFRDWLAQDYHGMMDYMSRGAERRLLPQKLLPGAKSIVCVALNYYTKPPAPTNGNSALKGTISRYAWGKDYHKVLFKKLKALRNAIAAEFGIRAKICVDTSAVLEKLWAQKAGLGWQGKHSNLITRELGSWVFLGEILLDADLDYDAPHTKNFCGTCTRCIDLCPTQAIVAPYVVDSRRCIAYLTIEYHGVIPRELRQKMGNLIFGCDICQDVCPWNKFAKATREAAFLPQGAAQVPYLARFMKLGESEFNQLFEGSPIRRAKRGGFLRNVAIALGNSHAPEAVEPLIGGLNDADPLVRAHSAWGLGEIGGEKVLSALQARLLVETAPEVRDEIHAALANFATAEAAL